MALTLDSYGTAIEFLPKGTVLEPGSSDEPGHFSELIEFWVENEVLWELVPPNMMQQYLFAVQPENLKELLEAATVVDS